MSEKKEKNSFIMLKEWGEQLQFLDDAQTAELFRMIFMYQSCPEDGVPVSGCPIVNSIFLTMRNFFDASEEKYVQICEKRKEAGSKGGKARAINQANQANATFASSKSSKSSISESESESEYEYDSDSDIKKEREKKEKADAKRPTLFKPPTLEDVEAYISEKGYHVNADAFMSFYDSNGWKVGKNKMKDWRAAICTWEQREKNKEPSRASAFDWMEIAAESTGDW